MQYKIAFFDVDGTLVDNETGQIPESTSRSIRTLQEKGVIVVIATGRSYGLSSHLRKELGVENFINFSGGYARLGDREIYKAVIPYEPIKNLITISHEQCDSLVFFGIDEIYSNGLSKEVALPILEKIDCKYYPEQSTSIDREEILSMCLFLDRGKIEAYESASSSLQLYQWGSDLLNAYNIEIRGTNKVVGVRAFLNELGLSPSEAIAFGDGGNDIEMLREVGLGVAMGNARQRLKEVADFVTRPVYEDGIEFALKTFDLI